VARQQVEVDREKERRSREQAEADRETERRGRQETEQRLARLAVLAQRLTSRGATPDDLAEMQRLLAQANA
jgi:hypothetical protein